MINRVLIRLKIVQIVYAYYQNGGKNLDTAEKELFFSLSKAYDLYNYLLLLMVDKLFSCSCTEAVTYISASVNHYPGGPSRIRFNGEAGIRITGE